MVKCSLPPGSRNQLRGVRVSTGGRSMLGIGDLFQWERFITPTVINHGVILL
jgi:hypothetical protein